MKAKTAIALCALLTLSALPASAAMSRSRSVTFEYSGPNTVSDPEENAYANFGIFQQATPREGERAVSVEVADDSGRPVLFALHQGGQELGTFCGASDKAQPLRTKKSVHVHLYMGQGCDDASTPTQGTITFTFER